MLVIAVASVLLGVQPLSIVHHLRAGLANETIGSKHFRKVMKAVLEEVGGCVAVEDDDLLMTSGDPRGCVVRVSIKPASGMDWPMRACLFFWPKSGKTHVQLLQCVEMGKDDYFLFGETYWRGDRLVMCGPANNGWNFNWASIRSYRFSRGAWRLIQSLKVNSGVGPHFKQPDGHIDPNHIVAPVEFNHQPIHDEGWYPVTDYYRVTYKHGRYEVGPHVRMPSPMTTLDDLIEAAKADDGKLAWLTDPSIRKAAKKFLAANSHFYVQTPDNPPFWSFQRPRLDVENNRQDLGYRMSFRRAHGRYILVAMDPLPKHFR
jgi:hypothetical protein